MKHLFIYLTVFFSFGKLYANNISFSNVQFAGSDLAAKWALVEFDLSWDNSWRTSVGPANWDAAWVFIKFRVGSVDRQMTASSSNDTVTVTSTAGLRVGMPVVVSSGTGAFATNTVISSIANDSQFVVSVTPTTALSNATIICRRIWEHAYLDTTDANHVAPNGSTIAVPNDSTGAFIYRSENGYGNFNLTDVRLRWKYGSNGLDLDSVDIQVFAIEMVYVPQGSFAAGSGGSENSAFTLTTINTATATTAPTGSGGFSGSAEGGYPSGQTAPANASWPNGYDAFYCMKYEISQGHYRDFLNTLTYAQQVNRTGTSPSSGARTGALVSNNSNRSGIDIQSSGVDTTYVPAIYGCNMDGDGNFNESNDGEWVACHFIIWADVCAYLDWAGLRPMTELEYEKACRGDQAPVANEYAWGSTSITGATGISNGGANNETFSNAGANCAIALATTGPLRVGAFAGGATTRAQAGATYYGIMEMSGSLWERVVSIGHGTGRAFTGTHGNGALSSAGNANATSWPGTSAIGSGLRGSNWGNQTSWACVSDRTYAVTTITTTVRYNRDGGRGVRTATQ